MKFHPIANIFPLMDGEPLREFCDDIKANGLRIPIALHDDGSIIDGRNRYRACLACGIEPTFEQWSGQPGQEVAYVLSLNLTRRHLNESQRAMVAARLATLDRGRPETNAQICAFTSQPEAAELLNVSRRSVQSARAVTDKGTPELVEAVEQGKITVSQATKIAKSAPEIQLAVVEKVKAGSAPTEAARQVNSEVIAQRNLEAPRGKYRVIYADPPWSYANDMPHHTTTPRDYYPAMSLQKICELPVRELAEDNAVLFLWTTSPHLEESFEVIKAWGFKYKTSFVWDKIKHNMGHYNSVRHEFLLVCVKGSCQPDVRKLFDSVVSEERGEHSAKPELFYDIIDTIYPNGERVELFARSARDGWSRWGYEAPDDE